MMKPSTSLSSTSLKPIPPRKLPFIQPNSLIDTQRSLQEAKKYGHHMIRSLSFKKYRYGAIQQDSKVNQVLAYIKRLKYISSIDLRELIINTNQNRSDELKSLSKQVKNSKKLSLHLHLNNAEQYNPFFRNSRPETLFCETSYSYNERTWEIFIDENQRAPPLKYRDGFSFLNRHPQLKALLVERTTSKEPDLPGLFNFANYPKHLETLCLSDILPQAKEIRLTPANQLKSLKFLRLSFSPNNKTKEFTQKTIQQFTKVYPQLTGFVLENLDSEWAAETGSTINLAHVTKAKLSSFVDRFPLTFEALNPQQEQLELVLKVKSAKAWPLIVETIKAFPMLRSLILLGLENSGANFAGFQQALRATNDNLPDLNSLRIHIQQYQHPPLALPNIQFQPYKELEKFFTRGVPLEEFELSVNINIQEPDFVELLSGIQRHSSTLRRVELGFRKEYRSKPSLRAISQFIKHAPKLTILRLEGVSLNDGELKKICQLLLRLPHLTDLFLSPIKFKNSSLFFECLFQILTKPGLINFDCQLGSPAWRLIDEYPQEFDREAIRRVNPSLRKEHTKFVKIPHLRDCLL